MPFVMCSLASLAPPSSLPVPRASHRRKRSHAALHQEYCSLAMLHKRFTGKGREDCRMEVAVDLLGVVLTFLSRAGLGVGATVCREWNVCTASHWVRDTVKAASKAAAATAPSCSSSSWYRTSRPQRTFGRSCRTVHAAAFSGVAPALCQPPPPATRERNELLENDDAVPSRAVVSCCFLQDDC